MAEYINREEVCKLCDNKKEYCGKEKCPVYKALANDVIVLDKSTKEAIEKQIPKKPIYVDTRFRNLGRHISDGVSLSKCYKCPNPNCNLHIFHVFDSDLHCKHCGQSLDWSDEK